MKRRSLDRAFTVVSAAGLLVAVLIMLSIVGIVFVRGVSSISWEFLTSHSLEGGAGGGIVYQLVGTVLLVVAAAAIAVPVAIAVGLMRQLYSGDRRRRTLDGALHALNAIPSIVFGLFGLAVFVQAAGWKKSWLAGAIVLAMMILPTMTLAFVERLRAIPHSTIEAATGLGLGRSQLAWGILLPQGRSGLMTGTLLGLARAAGETAPIMFTAAIFYGATVPRGIADSPVLALPYHIFVLAQDSFDPASSEKMWGSALVLLLLVISVSAIALPLRMRAHEEARRV